MPINLVNLIEDIVEFSDQKKKIFRVPNIELTSLKNSLTCSHIILRNIVKSKPIESQLNKSVLIFPEDLENSIAFEIFLLLVLFFMNGI